MACALFDDLNAPGRSVHDRGDRPAPRRDPTCGTGGFLVDAYQHLKKQCQTAADREILNSQEGLEHLPLEQWVEAIMEKEARIAQLMAEIKTLIDT